MSLKLTINLVASPTDSRSRLVFRYYSMLKITPEWPPSALIGRKWLQSWNRLQWRLQCWAVYKLRDSLPVCCCLELFACWSRGAHSQSLGAITSMSFTQDYWQRISTTPRTQGNSSIRDHSATVILHDVFNVIPLPILRTLQFGEALSVL